MQRRELLLAAAAAAALPAAVAAAEAKPEPFPVKGKVTVVDFGASWCAGCPEMEKRMKELQKEFGDRAAFVTVDIEDWPDIEKKYLIEQLPYQRFYTADGEVVWGHAGEIDKEELRDRVEFLIDYSKKQAAEKNKEAAK